MANRFLESNFFKSPFVRQLPGKMKSLYLFIICDCDGAGMWSFDLEAANLFIDFTVTKEEFDEYFEKKHKAVLISSNKYFFPDFIEHQYPAGLQESNKAHKNFILTLKKFDLLDGNLCVKKKLNKKPLQSPIEAPSKPLDSSFQDPSKTLSSLVEDPLKDALEGIPSHGNGNGNGKSQGNGKGNPKPLQSSFIVPEMCDVWYKTIPTYTPHKEVDFEAMGRILKFMYDQASLTDVADADNHIKILNTLQLVADNVRDNKFWVNQSLKSIANNINTFYNHIKNPVLNGTKSKSGTKSSKGSTREQLNDLLAKRYSNGGSG